MSTWVLAALWQLWPRCFLIAGMSPGSASLYRAAESGAALGSMSPHDGVTAFTGGSEASRVATSRTALGKGRRGCSSLRSKSYARDSSVTNSESAPPQFWLCWDQDPSLNAAKSGG